MGSAFRATGQLRALAALVTANWRGRTRALGRRKDLKNRHCTGLRVGEGQPRKPEVLAYDAGPEAITPIGIRAFHGSPASFERFSDEFIGTGEGAQALSHGHYLAEAEATGQYYRDTLTRGAPSADQIKSTITDALGQDFGDELNKRIYSIASNHSLASISPAKAVAMQISEVRPHLEGGFTGDNPTLDAMMEKLRGLKPRGHMYETKIQADPEHFLNWDEPLSVQSEHVRAATKKLVQDHGINLPEPDPDQVYVAEPTGQDVYRGLAEKLYKEPEYTEPPGVPPGWGAVGGAVNDRAYAARAASQALLEAGIPGMRYLDAMSRARASTYTIEWPHPETGEALSLNTDDALDLNRLKRNLIEGGIRAEDIRMSRSPGEGSRNYVVYNPRIIDILRKYGIAGLTGGGGAAAALSGSDANAAVPSYDEGGPIDETGIAMLHAGEFVVPAGTPHLLPDDYADLGAVRPLNP